MKQSCYSNYTQVFMKKIRYSVIPLFRYYFISILSVWLLAISTLFAGERNLLENSITQQALSQALVKGTEWVKTPALSNRTAWESLPQAVRNTVIKQGEAALDCDWPVIKASDYLEFTRSGNRDIMQIPQSIRTQAVKALALAELVEGKGRFIEALMNGVWALCEQSTWVLSAHLPLQQKGPGLPDPDDTVIDLSAGEIGALLSWVHYYFAAEFDKISPFVSEQIRRNIRSRILEPYYARTDFWWMGFSRSRKVNNWNPWVNYNVMQCILLMETDPQKRTDNIYKVMRSIDWFINDYPDDGGCDEGPSYWSHAGGKLYEGLELLYAATGGKVAIFENEIIKNIGRYIYRAYISDPYFVNFADAGAKGGINPGLVYRYGRAIHDPIMQGFGAFYAQKRDFANHAPSGSIETVIHDLFDAKEIVSAHTVEPFVGESWLPGLQFAVARDRENSRQGFFFAAKGGHNASSHNHNDVGSFILYYNGLPALIDVGVGTYTRQTFSDERYSIWTMQSGYHNLPAINGVDQQNGVQFAARDVSYKATAQTVNFAADIAGAYPAEAAVKSWLRSYQLNRGKSFIIRDKFTLTENKGNTSLHFMTSCKTTLVKPGVIRLEGDGFVLEMTYDTSTLNAKIEAIPVDDRRLQSSWGPSLTRIVLDFVNQRLTGNTSITLKCVS